MADLPHLSPAQQRAVEALLEGRSESEAYIVAYPNAARWKPETVEEKARALFKLSSVKAHVTAGRRRNATSRKKAAKKKAPAKRARTKARAPARQKPKGDEPKQGQSVMGRPSLYTPETLEIARRYLTEWNTTWGHNLPNIAGLAVVLGVSRETVHAWGRDETKQDFSDILSNLRTLQEHSLVNGGVSGEYNPTITKMILNAKHGYHDIQSVEHGGKGGGPIVTETRAITAQMTAEEAQRAYQDMVREE